MATRLRRRFEREARVTARLQHPSIVPVYGSGRGRGGQPFYAMKRVMGDPLDRVIATARTYTQRVALLPNVIAVTEAIAYAHSERVIHRDLKPANILIGAFGETVVIDWGLAKELAHPDSSDGDEAFAAPYRAPAADETGHGHVMGTPAYMPIEQARGEAIDERADVYALGAILYHVLAGRQPFRRADEDSVPWESMLARVLSGPPAPLETLQPEVPKDLAAIVARAMAIDRDARYPSAGELAADLKRFQTGQLVGAHRYSTWQLVRRWLRRHRTAAIVGGVAIALLAGVGTVSITRIIDEQQRTEQQRAVAMKSRGEAEGLMTFMLRDLRNKLEPLGKLELLDDVAKKANAYYRGTREGLTDTDLYHRAEAESNLGDVLAARGSVDDALAQFRESESIFASLLAKEWDGVAPDHFTCARNRTVALSKIGNLLLAHGRVADALAAQRESLEIGTALAAQKPESIMLRRDLEVDHFTIGDVMRTSGDSSGALVEYRASETIALELAAKDPTNSDRQDDLSAASTMVGMMLAAAGDGDGALAEYRRAVARASDLASKDPSNAKWQFTLATAHSRVGTTLDSRGDGSGGARREARCSRDDRGADGPRPDEHAVAILRGDGCARPR